MAKFPSLTFTAAGTQMLVQAQNGHTLTFTSGKLGSGVLSDSDDITKFTDLKSAKMTLPITSKDDSNPEKLILTFDASNTSLEEGFVSREIGIFAKLDSGDEQLYAYSNAGNNYDYIPSKDTPTDENRLVVSIVVSSSASINVQVDGSIVYVHKSDVESLIAAHNSATDAHDAMQATIDDTLGPTADLNTVKNLLSNLGNRIKAATGASGWKGNPATTLAAMATLASNLSSGSDVTWSGTKFTNTKLGISGVIDTNGYVSFGPNFGGLIIQWGTAPWIASNTAHAMFPISFNSSNYILIATGHIDDNSTAFIGGVLYNHKVNNSCLLRGSEANGPAAEYIAIGK